jgi:hypothetical protein
MRLTLLALAVVMASATQFPSLAWANAAATAARGLDVPSAGVQMVSDQPSLPAGTQGVG